MTPDPVVLSDHVWLLSRFADSASLMAEINAVTAQAALRRMQVPGGKSMSVAMTNCGSLGWVSDQQGYRYSQTDPLTGQRWPAMPTAFSQLARSAAQLCGFNHFLPDACLINCYESNAQLGLHRDADEQDFTQPIVSVSLGARARFSIGGLKRADPKKSIELADGDVLVWGGPARKIYHGVGRPLAGSAFNKQRYNLTFRKAQ